MKAVPVNDKTQVEDWNDTPQYSAKDDKTYEDREFWKDHDYDFEGTKSEEKLQNTSTNG